MIRNINSALLAGWKSNLVYLVKHILHSIYVKRPMKPEPIPEHHQNRIDTVSIYLRELRYSEGKTLLEISEFLGIHRNTVQRVETSHSVTLLTLMKFADFYEISVSELLSVIE